jgi:hypothetical protein
MRTLGMDTREFEATLTEFKDSQQARFALRRRLLAELYA